MVSVGTVSAYYDQARIEDPWHGACTLAHRTEGVAGHVDVTPARGSITEYGPRESERSAQRASNRSIPSPTGRPTGMMQPAIAPGL